MNEIVKIEDVKEVIITIRNHKVIPDFLVASLYNVETKDINRAVKNNPNKFPEGYILVSTEMEKKQLVKKFHQFNLKHSSAPIKLFTERGLYMLATILKSPIATQTTLAIIDTFAEVRELKRTLIEIHDSDSEPEKKLGMGRIGEILADLIMPDLETTETNSSLELNFVIGKLKHSVTRQRKTDKTDIVLKEKIEFAKRLLSKGFADDEIIELSGISKSEWHRLEKMIVKKANP